MPPTSKTRNRFKRRSIAARAEQKPGFCCAQPRFGRCKCHNFFSWLSSDKQKTSKFLSCGQQAHGGSGEAPATSTRKPRPVSTPTTTPPRKENTQCVLYSYPGQRVLYAPSTLLLLFYVTLRVFLFAHCARFLLRPAAPPVENFAWLPVGSKAIKPAVARSRWFKPDSNWHFFLGGPPCLGNKVQTAKKSIFSGLP